VEPVGDCYRLSEAGVRPGGLELEASFEEFVKPASRECSPGSWCQRVGDEAPHLEYAS
jgi:hypothetical protein